MKKATILYVEDEQFLMSGVVDSLSVEYNVIVARNADRGLKILENQHQQISLILLDIMMPQGELVRDPHHGRTSGVEFTRIVLQEKSYRIPIVCYTVVDDQRVRDTLRKLGVKEIVSKTELPSKLEQVIARVLRD